MTLTSLNRISEHVYWSSPDSTTDRPVLGAIAGRQATLMVDAGNSPAHAGLFLDGLATLGLAHPKYLLLTHWHWDHVFGASAVDSTVFASEETGRVIAEMAGLDWSDEALDRRVAAGTEIEFCRDMIKAELPDRADLQLRLVDVAFARRLEINLGGVSCLVKFVGGDHAADASVVYIPADKILFLSDCLYEDLYHGPAHYTTRKLFPLIDELMSFDAEQYIWGHNPEPTPKAEMATFVAALKTIGRLVERIGDKRDRILQELPGELNQEMDDDHIEIADAFLAGLRLSDQIDL